MKELSKPGDFKSRNTIPARRSEKSKAKKEVPRTIRARHVSSRSRIAARTPSNKASARQGMRTYAAPQLFGQRKRREIRKIGARAIPANTQPVSAFPANLRTSSGNVR